MLARWMAPLALLLLVGCGPGSSDTGGSPGGEESGPAGGQAVDSESGEAGGDVTLQVLDFEEIQQLIASHRGKVVVMDAWSTSCEPCMREFPHLVDLHKRYPRDQVACISLSFDYEGLDPPEDVQGPVLEFLSQQGATFDNVLSSDEADDLYAKFKLASIPAVFVYGRDGQLHKRFETDAGGEFSYADIDRLVAELLAAEAASSE